MKKDEEIVRKIQKGDTKALGEIIDRYQDKLVRYVSRLIFDNVSAEDIVQDTFIKVYKNIQSFDTKRRFSPWIYRIAHNEAMTFVKKRREKVPIESVENYLSSDTDLEKDAVEKFDKPVIYKELLKNLSYIPLKYREPLILKIFEEKSYEEISDILHIPIGTVGTLISRGKNKLKEKMKKFNIEEWL